MKKSILFTILLCLGLNGAIFAQFTWENTGVYGGNIKSLAVDASGNKIFAGTQMGVYLSTDNGSSWTGGDNTLGLGQVNINALAISGENVYAAVQSDGVFLSTDDGSSWTQINNGLSNTIVGSLAISGSNIYAGTENGVFLSTNSGSNWTAINSGITDKNIQSIAISGSNIFAGSWDGKIFLSTNNGNSWTEVSSGLTGGVVGAISIDGSNIFAGIWGGVFLSTDNGNNWTEMSNGIPEYTAVNDITIDGSNIFAGTNAGVFLSTDNGNNWTSVNNGINNTNIEAIIISASNIFAGSSGGVFLSSDIGSNWIAVNIGIAIDARAMEISGNNIFAGTSGGGVLLSTDNGSNWTAVNNGLTNTSILDLAIEGSSIFAGTFNGGVNLSTDNGSNWAGINNGMPNSSIKVNDIVTNGSEVLAGTTGGGVFLSTDNGSSWISINNGLPESTLALAFNGSDFFAGTHSGVYLSTDNGSNWTAVNNGLPLGSVMSLATSGSNIFAGTWGNGVYLSTDNGNNWTALNNGMPNTSVSSIATSGSKIIVGTAGGGVYFSTNNGGNWTVINEGLTAYDINSIAFNESYIFAGTTEGVWKRLQPESNFILAIEDVTIDDGQPLEVPITVSELTATDNIISYQFDIDFDNTIIDYTGTDLTGTLAEGGTVTVNASVEGQLNVSYMTSTAITGTGDILKLQFNTLVIDTTELLISNAYLNSTEVTDLTAGTVIIKDITPPTAAITYNDTDIRCGDDLLITATFSEPMLTSNAVNISLSGAAALADSVMTRISETVYTFNYSVPRTHGDVTLSLSNGTDLWSNEVVSVPTSGGSFTITGFTLGDVDDDGKILAYDAALTLQYSVGLDPLPAIDALPWENWRDSAANVDGTVGVTAYDAGMILQYSAGIITDFLGSSKKSAPQAFISMEFENDGIIFYSYGRLLGLNVSVDDDIQILGEPVILGENFMSAFNINDKVYKVGLCTARPPADGTAILKIPFNRNGSVNINMIVNDAQNSMALNLSTGITDFGMNDISIYPNPVRDNLKISGLIGETVAKIYGINGQLMLTRNLTNSVEEINVSDLSLGLYIIKLETDSETTVKRFIIH